MGITNDIRNKKVNFVRTKKKIEYADISVSFDIETYSFYEHENKKAIMYIWTLCYDGIIISGRTWEEFITLLKSLIDYLNINIYRRLVIYVHNLAYEFQFLRKWFEWDSVFAVKNRTPIQAITIDGIEFRCSYILSGYNLETLAKNLQYHNIKKLVGDLDYEKPRNKLTPLTKEEYEYCKNDVLIVWAYICEEMKKNGDISKIPLTKTGYVRRYCRNACYKDNDNKYHDKFKKYRKLILQLTLKSEDYQQLKLAFMGGFTHSNPLLTDVTLYDVTSYDFTSAYPYVMVSEKFPMSKPTYVELQSKEHFESLLKSHCCLFDCEFFNIDTKFIYEYYISVSHCLEKENVVESNGRIVSADRIKICLTEQDFLIMRKLYKWENVKITNFKIFRKAYLPTDFVKSILDLYHTKTTLKDVKGKEIEYLVSKENLNSCYGMTVTDICKDTQIYQNHEWSNQLADIEENIDKNNRSIKRFLYYPWGIWVTAYTRRNLFTGILECGEDYVYSDTDSIKVLNAHKHEKYINDYNEYVVEKLKIAMNYHRLPFELTCPKNIKGVTKQLGIWECEKTYDKFKTLGAKRYLTKINNDYSITVAGTGKKASLKYLLDKYGDKIFDEFSDGLLIPKGHTGKLTHTYCDDEIKGILTDYLGNKANYYEKSYIHLEPASFEMSMSEEFINYILGISTEEW